MSLSLPLGGHWYSREDLLVAYHKTATEDHSYVGASVAPGGNAPVDQTYVLVALRATAGYQLTSLASVRLGVLAGSHTLTTQHGFCGTGYAERDATSLAVGGTAALGLAFKHFDLSATGDVYSADTQQLCSVQSFGGGFGVGQPAALYPERGVVAQFLAQATILF